MEILRLRQSRSPADAVSEYIFWLGDMSVLAAFVIGAGAGGGMTARERVNAALGAVGLADKCLAGLSGRELRAAHPQFTAMLALSARVLGKDTPDLAELTAMLERAVPNRVVRRDGKAPRRAVLLGKPERPSPELAAWMQTVWGLTVAEDFEVSPSGPELWERMERDGADTAILFCPMRGGVTRGMERIERESRERGLEVVWIDSASPPERVRRAIWDYMYSVLGCEPLCWEAGE